MDKGLILPASRHLRPGVVSITHGFGGLDGDGGFEEVGARVNDLISTERHIETINAMPRMTGVRVNVDRLGSDPAAALAG